MPPPLAIVIPRTPAPPPVGLRELAALIAIIALADVALYQGEGGGAGLAILFTAIPAILFATARARQLSQRLAAISAILALLAGRSLWQTSPGATALALAMLAPFAIALRTPSYLPELIVSTLGTAWSASGRIGGFAAAASRAVGPVRSSRVMSAAFAIPALLVIVFGAIFAAANPVIQGWLGGASDLFSGLGWVPSPLRFAFWGICLVCGAGLLRPAISSIPAFDAYFGTSHRSRPTDAEPAAARTALARSSMIALNVLFLGYNALDAVYLWGGRAPAGVSHTEYAHAGTAWLSIAFVLSTIVLGALFRGPIEHHARGKTARILAYAWAGQNFILAVGTFRRITMYIAYSGLTELRIVGILGTMLATLGLAIVVYKVWRRRTMLWVMRRQLDALAIVLAIYLIAPTGNLAMRYNVARVQADQYRPLLHLFEKQVAPEALPALLPLLSHPDPVVREGIAVIAATKRDSLVAERARTRSWMDRQLARDHALAVLDDAAADIDRALPIGRVAALAQLRGVAYGINDEVEREGDDAPFDWRTHRYGPR